MKGWTRRLLLSLSMLLSSLLLTSAARPGSLALHGLATYVLLLDLSSVTGGGRLTPAIAARAATADASLDLARFTRLPDADMFCAISGSERSAPSLHAFVPRSYRFLPIAYRRDFVRSTLVGLSAALDAITADASKGEDARALALGQYLHFLQDIYLNQDRGAPWDVAPAAVVMATTKRPDVPADASTIPDGVLRAFMATNAAAKAWAQTGKVPAVSETEAFDQAFYAPLSPARRSEMLRSAQQIGVARYLEQTVRVLAHSPTGDDAASIVHDQLAKALSETWQAAHPQAPSIFVAPDLKPGSTALVDYDAHPDLLIPDLLRTREMEVRRVIDDATLAQQAADTVSSEIDRLMKVLAIETVPIRKQRVTITLNALREDDAFGKAALGRAPRAGDTQAAIGSALAVLNRGLQDAARLDIELGLRDPQVTGQDFPCPIESPVGVAAFESRLNFILRTVVLIAIGDNGAPPARSGADCGSVAFKAATAHFKGGAVHVPAECGEAVILSYELLRQYARSHIDRRDPVVEDLLARLLQEQPAFKR